MMTATKDLENDHEYIIRLTNVMEQMIIDYSTNKEHFETVVSLIRNFADGFHHAKEEKILFPKLVEKGFSNEGGPVGVMLTEHVEGRNYVKGMSDAIARLTPDDESAVGDILLNMQQYVDLLQAHIGKENNVLFRMADKMLSDDEQQALLAQYATVGESEYTPGRVNGFIEQIKYLESVYM